MTPAMTRSITAWEINGLIHTHLDASLGLGAGRGLGVGGGGRFHDM